MREVRWTALATDDLHLIEGYLTATYSIELARRVIRDLVLATYFLLDHPRAGSPLEYRRWRKWKPRNSRHILIYQPRSYEIEVVRVRHERNDWRPVPD